ncbi:hypothetical protein [Streptomyces sp. NRRL F-5135]|uniref:hypothetical protein n=1 Tax=Streptomyces sp. NRRL F-5135 TaxID=1463858 RepID=UPI00131C18CD|nr:hypothetical protein [Streptomyces sp. NRRL F-5135]
MPTPKDAYDDWWLGRPALLRGGQIFDAVRVQPELVHAAVGSSTPADVATSLARRLSAGPVICDRGIWYYALVPPGTTTSWRSALGTIRGRGAWIGVPALDRTHQTHPVHPHWIVTPRWPRRLCDPEDVAELLRAGQHQLEGAAR